MSSLLLVDLSGIFRAAWHASENDEVTASYARTVAKVTHLRQGFEHVAICCDCPPYFRCEVSPDYKANRQPMPPVFGEQLRKVKERLTRDGLVLWECRGLEADDVIATAVRLANDPPIRVETVTIASSDKDLLQLVDDTHGVCVLSPVTGETFDEAKVIEKFGVAPREIPDFLALMGDKSDNIRGLDKVGPVTAAKLLAQFGTLEGVLTHADDVPTPKLREAILAGASQCRLGRELITLRTDAPIRFEDLFEQRKVEPLRAGVDMANIDDADEDSIPEDVLPSPKTQERKSDPPPPSDPVQPKPTTALAVAPERQMAPVPFEQALEPVGIGGAYKLAVGMYNSRLYTKFPTAEACWAVIIRGREMGLGALTALDCFHVIEGKPALHAHLIIARAKADPDCEYFQFLGGDHTFAEYETKSKSNPKPTKLKYTIEQARQAGLVKGGSNWEKRPAEQLRKTCGVQLARIEYPSAAMGLYAIEELGD